MFKNIMFWKYYLYYYIFSLVYIIDSQIYSIYLPFGAQMTKTSLIILILFISLLFFLKIKYN